MRNIPFVNGEFYHIYNRGVDKRVIFEDEADKMRFYYSLYLFNDANFEHPGGKGFFYEQIASKQYEVKQIEKPLVNIVSFCMLPNHFHLELQQVQDDGISTFMHRLGSGYGHYYNIKHERSGTIFEGSFKAKLVEKDAYFLHLSRYINLNVLDTTNLNWREGKIQNWDEAEEAMSSYPWSSHHVYMGRGQDLPIVDEPTVRLLFPTREFYTDFLRGWSGRNTMGHMLDIER